MAKIFIADEQDEQGYIDIWLPFAPETPQFATEILAENCHQEQKSYSCLLQANMISSKGLIS